MNIRPATIWDAEKITDLWLAMHKEITTNKGLLKENSNRENLFLTVITRTKLPEWAVLVAEENDEIYGFSMGTAIMPRYNPCHVLGVFEARYIDPTRRGQGIAKMLNDKMFQWAASKNITEIEFLTSYSERLIRVYDRLGFEPVSIAFRKKEA